MDANKYQELAKQLSYREDKIKFIDKLITDFKDISTDLNVIRNHFAKEADKLKLDYFDRVTKDLENALIMNQQLIEHRKVPGPPIMQGEMPKQPKKRGRPKKVN